MNWDRVRKESQSMRSGIAWIGPDGTESIPGPDPKQTSARRTVLKKTAHSRITMQGCTCNKVVGFRGDHKHTCPLRHKRGDLPRLLNDARPTLEHFAESMRKVDQHGLLSSFLSSVHKHIESNRTASEQDRKEAQKLIQFFQDKLIGPRRPKSEMNSKMDPSFQAKLTALLQLGEHLYLRAENKDAVHALQSAATELGLKLYQFQCSLRTKETDLSGFPGPQKDFRPTAMREAFANGGIFCIESIEKASSNLQFWLKGWLNAASLGMNSTIKKHPDFTIVVTSPTPMRQLWSGQIDPAFMDCLAYLDMKSDDPSVSV